MNIKNLTAEAPVYQIKEGTYELSFKGQWDPKIVMARQTSSRLPFQKCNQLVGIRSEKSQSKSKVYHPIVVLSPQIVQIAHQSSKQQYSYLSKSNITAASDQKQGQGSQTKKISSQNSINEESFSNGELLQFSELQLTSNLPVKLHRKVDCISQNKQEIDKEIDIQKSTLMKLQKLKANQNSLKLNQTPFGYQSTRFNANFKGINSLFQEIQLPKPSNRAIESKKKLVSLFDLKNSESQDDLCYSHHNESAKNFNPAKIIDEKSMIETDQVNFPQQLIKITSTLYNSIIEADDKWQHDGQLNQFYYRRTTSKTPSERENKSQQIQEKSYLAEKKTGQNLADECQQLKKITGIRKCHKRTIQHKQNDYADKKLETPKFGKNFSFER